jgi:hypothetical protein
LRRTPAILVLALACAVPAVAAADNVLPIWRELTPPYVEGHRLVAVPSRNAVFQVGGTVPADVGLPGYPQPSPGEVGGLWVWPLDGRAPFGKGPLGAGFSAANLGAVFFEPVGNRLLHVTTAVEAHDVTSPGSTWTPVATAGTPPPETGLVGFDAATARALLVTRATSHDGPVRVFALATTPGAEAWTELATIGAPTELGPETRAALDSTGRRLVVVDHAPIPPEVWTLSLDALTWSVYSPAIPGFAPGGTGGVAVAWDEANHRLLAYGGNFAVDGSPAFHLWQLVLEPAPQWSLPLGVPLSSPEARTRAALAWDPVSGRLFMNGGATGRPPGSPSSMRNRQLWAHPLGATPLDWGVPSPPALPRTNVAMASAADLESRTWYVHGGASPAGGNGRQASDSLWAVPFDDPTRWELVAATGAPILPRSHHVAVFDPSRRELWLHGGFPSAAPGVPGTLRRFRPGPPPTWEDVMPTGGGPLVLGPHAALHDGARDRLLFFMPRLGAEPVFDAWALDLGANPPDWSLVPTTGAAPPLVTAYTASLDAATDRAILFGGFLDPDRSVQGEPGEGTTDSTWALDLSVTPAEWSRLRDLPGEAADVSRGYHTAVVDPARRILVVAFGQSDRRIAPSVVRQDTRTDVWALELDPPGGWIALPAVTPSPRPRFDAIAMFDPTRERMLLAGGRSSTSEGILIESGYADDVWALDFDLAIPIALELVEARVDEAEGAVHLAWWAADARTLAAQVERRVADGSWESLGPPAADPATPDRLVFVDRAIVPAATHSYRLRWRVEGVDRTGGFAEVTVGAERGVTSALVGLAGPNPARDHAGWTLACTLPPAGIGTARLEVLDVRGRVVWARDLAGFGAGRHVVSVAGPGVARPGLYFARLGGAPAVVKLVRVAR